MSSQPDPPITTRATLRVMAPQMPKVCGLCLGTGSYLEALADDPMCDLVTVLCKCCHGSGRRS